MTTPLSVISLDQGKELARRQVARLHAEPSEAASGPDDEAASQASALPGRHLFSLAASVTRRLLPNGCKNGPAPVTPS